MLQFYFILKNIFFIFVFIFIQSNYIFADKLLVNCGGDFNTFLRNIGEVAINQGIDKNDVFLVLKNTQRSKKVLSFDRKQSTFRLSFTDFSKKADVQFMSEFIRSINLIAEELGLKEGYRLITNIGKYGGQEVPHLHFHLLSGKKIGKMVST